MTGKTLSLLEIARDGQVIGHLIGEAPDWWLYRASDGGAGHLPAWSALARDAAARVNQRAWFRNLLPDAPAVSQLSRRLGTSPGNDFAVLGLCGADCRGALSIARPGNSRSGRTAAAPLDVERLRRWAQALAEHPAPVADGDIDFLLPGEAGQLPCAVRDAVPVTGPDRHWLVRVGRPGLDEAVENEALCAQMARSLGLPVASTGLADAPLPMLITERLDCVRDAAGGMQRRHLEDFCQLSGLHPEQSFEREGGLAVLDCANLIRRYSAAPALDLRVLLNWLVFAFHTGLGHAHARTLALAETPRGPRLVVWDGLVSTHVYPGEGERLAMFVGREDRPDWIRLARWRELAEEIGVGPRYLVELVRQMAQRLPGLAAVTAATLGLGQRPLKVLPRVLKLVENRARQTLIAVAAEHA